MDEKQRKYFSQRLKELRKTEGLTQGEIARKFFVSRSCWSNYETGDRTPNSEIIKNIAAFFNVTVEYLMGDELFLAEEADEINSKASRLKSLNKRGFLDLSELSSFKKATIIEFYEFLKSGDDEKSF